jgi:RNA polymerase sigma-70 factor (ECF subfamily)
MSESRGHDDVIERYVPALWRLAGSFEFDAARREDLLQDMLLAVWRALPKLDDPARLDAYVFRIARNRAVSHVARQARLPRAQADAEDLPNPHCCPYAEAEGSERHERLRRALNALPLGQREAVTLFFEGLSHAQIAEVLGVTENNVAVRINRARIQLMERLKP